MTLRQTSLALLATLALSCGSEDLTQLMVVVDTDFDVPTELDEIAITVDGPDGQRAGSEGAILAEDLPLRLAVVHRGGPLGPIRVKVEGLLRGGVEIQRRADVDFIEGEVRELRMDLLRSCKNVACAVDETCGAEGCRPRVVSPAELAPYDGPMRLDFGMPDMGPVDMNPDGCVPVEEMCDEQDNDCDGAIDETFDVANDMRHCGECNNACTVNPLRGSMTCTARECVLVCDDGFGDCDDDPDTGCEASLTSAATCGSCTQPCEGATPVCDLDTCVSDCPEGTTLCGGDSCADLQSSVGNCGTCGNDCPDAPNASPLCAEGDCRLRCDTGFFNCDTEIASGCESRLRENANCGACGATCAADQGVTSCATGACELVTCDMGFGDCDGDLMNGCEANLTSSTATCGDCDTACPIDPENASPICTMGSCGVACDPGYADCNTDPADGCETFLGETTSCGGCAITCDGGTPVCSGSTASGFSCTADCAAGETVCGESCVDLSSDVRNCDSCGNVCPDPMRSSPTCTDGTCGYSCDSDFADCDGEASNGCEADLTSTSDCGDCDNVCDPVTDGTVACVMETCTIASCTGSKRNCDGVYANGCETDISSDADHCGGCGLECIPGPRVTSVSCTDGSCAIETCEAGFADCDGDFATGCEQRLGTRSHCGGCFDDCGGGPTGRCCDGICGC